MERYTTDDENGVECFQTPILRPFPIPGRNGRDASRPYRWRKGAFVVALLTRKLQTSGDSIFRRGTKNTKKFNAKRQRRRDAKKNFKEFHT